MSIYVLISNMGTESEGPTSLTKQLINGHDLEQFKSINPKSITENLRIFRNYM